MQKPIIDAEAFMKFFEETTGAKFVDVEIGKIELCLVYILLANINKNV